MNADRPTQTAHAETLMESRERFLNFVASRLGDRELAEDVLQESLIRALRAAPELRDESRLVPWFYAVLRNAITDAHRKRAVERRHFEPLPATFDHPESPAEAETVVCECFRSLLPALRPEYAEVIERLDLQRQPAPAVVSELGITANNLKVRHHRARRTLRERLEDICRICADHGCLDCTCAPDPL